MLCRANRSGTLILFFRKKIFLPTKLLGKLLNWWSCFLFSYVVVDIFWFLTIYILDFGHLWTKLKLFPSNHNYVVNFEHLSCYHLFFNKPYISLNILRTKGRRNSERITWPSLSSLETCSLKCPLNCLFSIYQRERHIEQNQKSCPRQHGRALFCTINFQLCHYFMGRLNYLLRFVEITFVPL